MCEEEVNMRNRASLIATVAIATACGPGESASRGESDVENDREPEVPRDAGKDAARTRDSGIKGAPAIDAGGAARTQLPCDVARVVKAKCWACHSDDPSAPMTLTTAADFQAQTPDKRATYTSAKEKINDADPRRRMPPASAEPLTEEELEVLNQWLDEKALGSAETCTFGRDGGGADAAGGAGPEADLNCYRLLAHNGDGKTPLDVGIARDVYYAYVFAAPWKEISYGMIVRPVIDNKQVLHHWLLFQDNVPGIPTGAVPQIGAHPTGQLLAAWAPGADPMDFREVAKDAGGVGLELPADTTYTVEFHYNSEDPAAKDASGIEVCVAKTKPKNIAAFSWVGYDNLGFPSAQWQGTCRPLSTEPIHIISFMPHMHLKGTYMKGTIVRANGAREVVHDRPFDFNYQRSYAVDLTLNPGDSLLTDCTFSEPAVFGQATTQEMCYLFSMAYPKGALASLDAWGTVAHGSSSCLGQ